MNWYNAEEFVGEILQKIWKNFQVFGKILGKLCTLNLATLQPNPNVKCHFGDLRVFVGICSTGNLSKIRKILQNQKTTATHPLTLTATILF